MSTEPKTLAEVIGLHQVETVTTESAAGAWNPNDEILVDCRCGAEIKFPRRELSLAPIDSTAGALGYMLRHHLAVEIAKFQDRTLVRPMQQFLHERTHTMRMLRDSPHNASQPQPAKERSKSRHNGILFGLDIVRERLDELTKGRPRL